MNLLTSHWIPVRLADGSHANLCVQDIPASGAVGIAHTRADFAALTLELVIDIFQTIAPLEDDSQLEAWLDGESPALSAAIAAWAPAFELFGDQGFMQLRSDKDERIPAGRLIYEAPGEQTLKRRTDFFVKDADSQVLCPRCAAVGLYLNQAHARTGGKGYFAGPRGGSTLAAIVQGDSLWETICLNLLPDGWFDSHFGTEGLAQATPQLLPWCNQEGLVEESQVHPAGRFGRYGVLWWSPRAVQLFPEANPQNRPCDACGEIHPELVTEITMKAIKARLPDGVRHPRTAWLPDKGNTGRPLEVPMTSFTAESWLTLLLTEHLDNALPAYVALTGAARESVRLRCFGYSMDKASPKVWMDDTSPLVLPESPEHRMLMRDTLIPLVKLIDGMTDALFKALFVPAANKVSSDTPLFPFVVNRYQAIQMLWQQMRPTLLEALKRHGPLTQEQEALVGSECRSRTLKLFDLATAPLMSDPRYARLLINRKRKLLKTVTPKTTAKPKKA